MLHRAKPFVDISRIIEELHSSDLTCDQHLSRFEEKLRGKIGVPYCAAIGQGRAALLIALRILGIGKGDEVIAPSFICQVVIDAIRELGATPVFADSSTDDFNISPAEVMKRISESTKAIVAAHIHGIPCDIDELVDIARQNDCYLIEDCAHTMNAKYMGENVGTFGDLAFFSMNFDKPFSTGQGGALAINNERLLDRANAVLGGYEKASLEEERAVVYGLLIEHLLTQKDAYSALLSIGAGAKLVREDARLFQLVDRLVSSNASEVNFTNHVYEYLRRISNPRIQIAKKLKTLAHEHLGRVGQIHGKAGSIERIEAKDLLMGPMRAIVGSIGLESLDRVDMHRNEIAKMLQKRLDDLNGYIRPRISNKKKPTFLRYSILNRTKHPLPQISRYSRRRNIELSNFNWSKPVHLIPPYDALCRNRSELKTSELIASSIINLPTHYYVNENDVDTIVTVLEHFERDATPLAV
jgi:perosamine synthetase